MGTTTEEASILSAVERLEGDRVKDRNQGLNDLQRVLDRGGGTSGVESLNEDVFHKILEVLFRIIRTEKPTYARASKPNSRTSAASRLETAAKALKLVVRVSGHRLKHKTVNAVLDHIVDTLPTNDEGFCAPIEFHYLTIFRMILEHVPHIEHLRAKQWQTYVDFLLEGITMSMQASLHDDEDDALSISSRQTMTTSSRARTVPFRSQSSNGQPSEEASAGPVAELLMSLNYLTSVTNAPLASRATQISDLMLSWIETTQRLHEGAFEVLNNLLPLALTEDVKLASAIFNQVAGSIQRLWNTKSESLKPQMIATLYYSRYIYANNSLRELSLDRSILDSLVDTIWSDLDKSNDLNKSNDQDMLFIDDLSFVKTKNPPPLSLRGISPASEGSRVTNAWSTLSILASLIIGLDGRKQMSNSTDEAEGPRKRRKIESPIADVLHRAYNSTGRTRIVTLQLALFIMDRTGSVSSDVSAQVQRLGDLLVEDDSLTISWLFILLARCADLFDATSPDIKDFWQRVWAAASRASTSASYSRPACHLMECLLVAGVMIPALSGPFINESIFPEGSNGPGALTDTAIILLTTVLRSNFINAEKQIKNFSGRSLRWLELHWTIRKSQIDAELQITDRAALVPDRSHRQLAAFGQPDLLYSLLLAITGQSYDPDTRVALVPAGAIYNAGYVDERDLAFTRFLLDGTDRSELTVCNNLSALTSGSISAKHAFQHLTVVKNMLSAKVKSFHHAWQTLAMESASNVNADIADIAATACILLISLPTESGVMQRDPEMPESVNILWQEICTFCSRKMGEDFQALVVRIGLRVMQLRSNEHTIMQSLTTSRVCLVDALLKLTMNVTESQILTDPDLLASADTHAPKLTRASRQDLPIPSSTHASYTQILLMLKLDSHRAQTSLSADTDAMGMIVDEFIALEAEDLLLSRDLVVSAFEGDTIVSREDARRFLEHIAVVCLRDDRFERCEAALCLCLRILLNFSNLWISSEEDALGDLAYDIYEWYLDVVLDKRIASKRVLLSISLLMDRVLQCDPNYAHDNLPSPRTTILKILKQGQNALRYNITSQLSRLFDGYVLSEHSAIFDDVVENLPANADQMEDIAVRLHVFSYLGARWHTILRQAVYHIFETAANVPSTASTARGCIKSMCKVLNLQQPRALLRQFSSQVLFTWLERQSIDLIPYQAFGYTGLSELIQDMQDEFVAQIAMRGSTEHAQQLVHHTKSSWDALVEGSFPRVVAYALISDVSGRRSSQQIGKAETFLIDQLGEDKYALLLREHFPEALAAILVRLGDDRGFEKAWGDDSRNNLIISRFEEMCRYSSSQMNLPSGQQPSLRAKYLMQILERLCTHAGVAMENLWTSATVVSACRMLLDDTRPTFGPLHACAVLRKIRMLICMAFEVTTTGYPLEMLLHNLRPFLTQFYCSEDALGIFRFLLEHGKPFLQSNLPFISGLGVSIFASLSEFVTSPQDSTTQESHYNSTMTQAQEFRKWLGDYLSSLSTQKLHATASVAYIEIVRSAKEINKSGSSSRSTPEGTLLYNLLVDQASEKPLLSSVFFRLTLQSLCHDFSPSVEYEDDILTEDEDIVKLTSVLWSVLIDFEAQSAFRVWIAQAMGRAYALQGPEKVFSTDSAVDQSNSTILHLDQQHSYHRIMAVLNDRVWVDHRPSASAAEQTLQAIFSSISPKDKKEALSSFQDDPLFDQLRFDESRCPRPSFVINELDDSPSLQALEQQTECRRWASQVAIDMCRSDPQNSVLTSLVHILRVVPSLAMTILPQIVHIILLSEFNGQRSVRDLLSTILTRVLDVDENFLPSHAALALDILLYLRRCVMPSEATIAQRNTWLAIDFQLAAAAAARCELYQTALLMLEVSVSQNTLLNSRASRRSSQGGSTTPQDLLASIYHHVDDPDFFYGMLQETDVASVVAKLCHEGDGHKALSFQSALLDANVKSSGTGAVSGQVTSSTAAALTLANYYGLARSLTQQTPSQSFHIDVNKDINTSMNLQQWDTWQPGDSDGGIGSISNAFQVLSSASHKSAVLDVANKGLLQLTEQLASKANRLPHKIRLCGSLAVLSELKETMQIPSSEVFHDLLDRHLQIKKWSRRASFDNAEPILLGREASFGAIRENTRLQGILGLTSRQSLLLEIKTLRASLDLGHAHERSQFCLNRAAYLSDLAPKAEELGLRVRSAIQYDLANTLWTQDEATASITILQSLHTSGDSRDQDIAISQSEILTDLGQKLTQARLDRPDEVTSQYLQPAIKALGDVTTGSNAGRVYHNFAAFCDQQLRDPDNLEEYSRIEKLRNRKRKEVEDLEAMKKVKEGKERDLVKSHLMKAQTWFKLDDQEWRRLKKHREELIGDCLENYLRAMRACDDFPNDVLRFLALWLDQSANEGANATVRQYLPSVPSIKFAPLVNQLSSRVLDAGDSFQRLLFDLLYRISNEHPFHSLYQVFATSKSKGQKGDTVATSRYAAATKLADAIMKRGSAGSIWISIHNSNIGFVRIATDRVPDKELKTGAKLQLRGLPSGVKLQQTIQDLHHKIPPPTMSVSLRADRDYSSMPTLSGFDSSITIAGGVSAPKIVTALASDGSRHKMLLKGGNDDLRQDSIMEQVFEQVSNLLGDHRATRQRKLGIRTYKVIPLTHNAGIIEFVKNTMPLHDYVLPAHTRYFPKDYKPNRCRKDISDAQSKSLNQRLQAYRNVCANFHPVMRFFFTEHFLNPDEWFQKRLNYSRSTAAISMLGHVLGLGDRHGHNILLDTNTGEVVHIDLGVAFEAGRILPVPEVVPFRLTRDLVDGMGLSGVEGVFRRCCNFSLEALRQDQEAIITILDVLRWDPLYSWSVSPLRLQRMQENEQQAANSETAAGGTKDARMLNGTDLSTVGKRDMSEPGEADRALAVVAKKLGKSLSVEATVNELIRQATDERNLAVLYCGWAAYA